MVPIPMSAMPFSYAVIEVTQVLGVDVPIATITIPINML